MTETDWLRDGCNVHVFGRHPLPPELRGTRYNFCFSYLSISIPYFMFLGKVSNKVRSILTIASLSRIPKGISRILFYLKQCKPRVSSSGPFHSFHISERHDEMWAIL
uniref:Uncharacterized protein n=1 Tax=Cacopsylla melanoneura TaxID=428564 RepID=A0A8D8YN85_9HEMI